MAYTLELTAQDVTTIAFVGGRYNWSDALTGLETGTNEIAEPEAWEILEAFESDTEGGHDPFPMLDTSSDLCTKLYNLWESIV